MRYGGLPEPLKGRPVLLEEESSLRNDDKENLHIER